MTRFALLELHSGFVWAIVDAASPEQACAHADAMIGTEPRDYERISHARDTGGGYEVHEAPNGFDISDGQNAEEIARVEALPLSGFYRAML